MFRPMLFFNGVKENFYFTAKQFALLLKQQQVKKLSKTSEARLKERWHNENATANTKDTILKFYMNIH